MTEEHDIINYALCMQTDQSCVVCCDAGVRLVSFSSWFIALILSDHHDFLQMVNYVALRLK